MSLKHNPDLNSLKNTIIDLLLRINIYKPGDEQLVVDAFANASDHPFHDDFKAYIGEGPRGYTIEEYERGIIFKRERGCPMEHVVYRVLFDAIQTMTHKALLDRYQVDNRDRHLNYTDELMAEWGELIEEAFRDIGEEYWNMYRGKKEME
ncbi:Imm63 family immunity protein [Paenibacillus sp. JX-17]|uniref:Imm63 family immunity protein n=1 Tax=Paenibacillus lacisoli TaxID=3064525 RepID=A0ABT9CES5_9BACL|nr:Imm63 family immunity protein [Paenibacillus sp. JX-17]MDO7907770.1 Imm63 family immunity protein [Paenibacillus sp. JX-17]